MYVRRKFNLAPNPYTNFKSSSIKMGPCSLSLSSLFLGRCTPLIMFLKRFAPSFQSGNMGKRSRLKWKERLSLISCKNRIHYQYLLDFWTLPSSYRPHDKTFNPKGISNETYSYTI